MKQKVAAKLPQKLLPFVAIGALFIALSLFLSFAPGVARGWGLNYIAGFDIWVIALYYLCLLCFLLPQTNQYLAEKITAISRKSIIATLGRHRYVLFAAISIAAMGVFYLLKIKYVFGGDLLNRSAQIERGELDRNEYLSLWSLSQLYVRLHEHFNFTVYQTIKLVDYITGGLFIFFSLCTANLLGNTFLKKVAAFIITASCAILLQFCGYNETYAFPLLFIQAYFFTCLLYLKNKTHIIVPTLVLLTGIAFHLMLVALFPSLVLLFYRKGLWKYPFFRSKITIVILILISLPFLYFAFWNYAFPIMLPLEAPEGFLTLFAVAHFKEFINSQLLGGGVQFLVWLMLLIYSAVFKIKYYLKSLFFLIASLSFIGLVFVFNPTLGTRDWDILAFAAVACNVSNAHFLLMLYDKKWCKNIKYGILMVAGFSICHTSMWLLTSKTDASIQWVERAYSTDNFRMNKDLTNENLVGKILSANNVYDRAIHWWLIYYQKHPEDPRSSYNVARALVELNRKEEACAILEENIKIFPFYDLAYALLIDLYVESFNDDALYAVLVQMEQAYKQRPEVFIRQQLSQEDLNNYWGALAELRQMRAARQ